MNREFYLELAKQGLRMPIGADMILHEQPNPQACRLDGESLGKVLVETAERFGTPLAFPLMDLRVEKEWLLQSFGVPAESIDTYHFDSLTDADIEKTRAMLNSQPTPAMEASLGAIRYVAENTDLVPVGMSIGPFSLMTKLINDPITAVFLAGMDPESPEAVTVFSALEMTTLLITRWVELQIQAGAKAVCVCEPAFNKVYLSPNQYKANPELLEKLVVGYNRRIREVMEKHGVGLIFHDCGELSDEILQGIDSLQAEVVSLGSPSDLVNATKFISKQTVLFGNLPSKKFYSDNEMTQQDVCEASVDLLEQMKAAGHPFILATECDVLSVQGCEETIMKKVMAMLTAGNCSCASSHCCMN